MIRVGVTYVDIHIFVGAQIYTIRFQKSWGVTLEIKGLQKKKNYDDSPSDRSLCRSPILRLSPSCRFPYNWKPRTDTDFSLRGISDVPLSGTLSTSNTRRSRSSCMCRRLFGVYSTVDGRVHSESADHSACLTGKIVKFGTPRIKVDTCLSSVRTPLPPFYPYSSSDSYRGILRTWGFATCKFSLSYTLSHLRRDVRTSYDPRYTGLRSGVFTVVSLRPTFTFVSI